MSFNISFQPNAATLGSYAYQASAIKQARDNLDRSIERGIHAAEFNANMGRQVAEWNATRGDMLANRDMNRADMLDERMYQRGMDQQELQARVAHNQALIDERARKQYDDSRDDFDKTLADGVKNGWLRIEPEQKQKLRQLAAAESQVSMRDDLDDQAKLKMLNSIHNERRNILPTVVPEFDRPIRMDEQVGNNIVVLGKNGVRQLSQGETMAPGEVMYHVGTRNGSQHMTKIDMGEDQKQPSMAGANKDWGRMSPAMKYSHVRAEFDDRWEKVSKQMLDNLKNHDSLGLNNKPVFGYEVTTTPDGETSLQLRQFDLSNPRDAEVYAQSAMLLTTPGMAYNDDNIVNEVNRRDAIVGAMGGQQASQQQFTQQAEPQQQYPTKEQIDADPSIPRGQKVIGIDPATGERRWYMKN